MPLFSTTVPLLAVNVILQTIHYKSFLLNSSQVLNNPTKYTYLIEQVLAHHKSQFTKYLIKWVNPENAQDTTWEYSVPDLKYWISQYNKYHTQPFEIPWKFLTTDHSSTIPTFESTLYNINLPISWKKQIHYLGSHFTNLSNQNSIIDPEINYAIFKAKFLNTHNKLASLFAKLHNLNFDTKLRFIHTFSEPHTSLFAQILPNFHTKTWQLKILYFKYIAQFLDLPISPILSATLSKFTGLITPKWRWIQNKLNFFYNLIK